MLLISQEIIKDHIIYIALDDLENDYLLDVNKLNKQVKTLLKEHTMYYLVLDEIYVSPLPFQEYYDDVWNDYSIYGGIPVIINKKNERTKS